MAELSVNGARLEYIDEGRGDPPFVFVHGWACDLRVWEPQLADLSRDHRCIAVNLRGRGNSQAVPPFHPAQAADDVATLMQELGLGRAIVVGHSLGGLIALLLNDRHPELVLGIVMGDPPITGAREGRLEAASQMVAQAGSMAAAAPMVDSFLTEATPPEVRELTREMMLSCPADVGAGMLTCGDVFVERMEDLIRVADQKPFMAFWAEEPRGEPRWLREITTFLRQEPMAGAGHFFQLEQPEVTNALLRAFLDDVARDPRIER